MKRFRNITLLLAIGLNLGVAGMLQGSEDFNSDQNSGKANQNVLNEVANFCGYESPKVTENEKTAVMKAIDENIKDVWARENARTKQLLQQTNLSWPQTQDPQTLLGDVAKKLDDIFSFEQPPKTTTTAHNVHILHAKIRAILYNRNIWYTIIDSFKQKPNEKELNEYINNILKRLEESTRLYSVSLSDLKTSTRSFYPQLMHLLHHLKGKTPLMKNDSNDDINALSNHATALIKKEELKQKLTLAAFGILLGSTTIYYCYQNSLFASISTHASSLCNSLYERIASLPFSNYIASFGW